MSTLNALNIRVGQSSTPANNITVNTDTSGDLVFNKGAPGALTEITRIKNNGELAYTPAGTGAVATTVQSKLRESVSVKDFGAVGDGSTDDSAAIQAAIDACVYTESKPYNSTVYLPSGVYRLNSGILLKNAISLCGSGISNTIINVYDITNPAVSLESYSNIDGITFKYPNQVISGTPIQYPPCISQAATGGGADYTKISNIRFMSTYIGISLGVTGVGAGKVTIENIDGFPYKTGIEIDRSYDNVRINNVHFNPSTQPFGDDLKNWVFNNGTAFLLKRADSPQLSNILAYGYMNGLRLTNSPIGGGSANMVQTTNFIFDICKSPIVVDACQDGVYFSNGICTSTNNYLSLGSNGGPCGIGGGVGDNIYVNFSNVSFRHFYTAAVIATANVYFSNCEFDDFNYLNTGGFYDAININAHNISVNASNCRFNMEGRSGSRGIVSNTGITGVKVFLSGCEFNGAHVDVQDVYLFDDTCKLHAASCLMPKGFYWNGIYGRLVGGNQFGTFAIPNGGTWDRGARFLNSYPAVGEPKGWICTVSGTPGTWVSEGNL
jgi:hypothetical protein